MEIGAALRPARGETISGDAFRVLRHEAIVTVVVADGVGHGPGAALAAARFCGFVETSVTQTPAELLHGAHKALAGTRGAAGVILQINTDCHEAIFAGVGNVELVVSRKLPKTPICTPGIIGYRMRRVLPFSFLLSKNDLLVLFSDGISQNCLDIVKQNRHEPQELAGIILQRHGKEHEDATCVAIRY